MEIDQVKTFLAVAAQGGFRRAAEVLNVSQPAVSARIQALEDSLGAILFTRGTAKLALTAAGRTLRPYAEQLLRDVAGARQAVHELQPSAAGALRIAAALSVCTYFLPDVLKRYQTAHPKTMVTVRAGHSKEVLKMVVDGEADMGVARALNHPDIETTTLRDDPLILAGHPRHPNASQPRARLEEVEAWPLIFYDRGSSDWTLTQGLFRRAGLLPNVVLEVEGIEAAKRMVERRLGLGFLPLIAVAQELRSRKLRAIEIIDAEPLHRNLDVIHLRHQPLTPEALAFFRLLEAAAAHSLDPFPHGPARRRALPKPRAAISIRR
ncbi:MAG TPA: LysR family transcriptional regulator [Terriglobia bacterium]|jgi:DNA-binding transcriptional LysR family regulator|nr:LysR family transcriptional regulator [Terriglobia bacterium]